MALQSQLFSGDSKLEAAAVSDPAHILPGAHGPHVAKIQQALIKIDGAAIAPDSVYGPATAAAVRAFKQKRNLLNSQGQIDDITGKKTVAAMDEAMLAVERSGGSRLLLSTKIPGALGQGNELPFLDLVVRFRGGTPRDARENLGDLSAYIAKTPKRVMFPISKQGVDPDASGDLIAQVVKEIDDQFGNPLIQPGVICINGNSVGARNALQLAAALKKGKHKIKFLGLSDAALFSNLPGMNKPRVPGGLNLGRGSALNFPHWGTPPSFEAEIKQNFFQNADNNFTIANRALSAEWTGNIFKRDQEVHGLISGFPGPPDPGDPAKNGGIEIEVPITKRATGAHEFAGDAGDKRNGDTIRELLTAL